MWCSMQRRMMKRAVRWWANERDEATNEQQHTDLINSCKLRIAGLRWLLMNVKTNKNTQRWHDNRFFNSHSIAELYAKAFMTQTQRTDSSNRNLVRSWLVRDWTRTVCENCEIVSFNKFIFGDQAEKKQPRQSLQHSVQQTINIFIRRCRFFFSLFSCGVSSSSITNSTNCFFDRMQFFTSSQLFFACVCCSSLRAHCVKWPHRTKSIRNVSKRERRN